MSALRDIARWCAPHGWWLRRSQAEERRQIERQRRRFAAFIPPGSLVFDVGANVGNRIDALLGCGARIVAVEPQPACVDALRRKFGARITVVPAAAGAARGRLPLHLADDQDVTASLSTDFIAQMRQTGRFGRGGWRRAIEVDVTTLDELIAEHGAPAFVKVDVEGFEEQVLAGLTRPVPVLAFEWNPDRAPAALACIDRLTALGLRHFQFSFGESMAFSHRTSLGTAAARSLIEMLGEEEVLFGDIYASVQPLVR